MVPLTSNCRATRSFIARAAGKREGGAEERDEVKGRDWKRTRCGATSINNRDSPDGTKTYKQILRRRTDPTVLAPIPPYTHLCFASSVTQLTFLSVPAIFNNSRFSPDK
jgi:hypothetical protein